MSWRNYESDTMRVRDKTLSRQGRKACVVCGVSIEPTFTPSGGKVYLSRCPTHEKETTHGRRSTSDSRR